MVLTANEGSFILNSQRIHIRVILHSVTCFHRVQQKTTICEHVICSVQTTVTIGLAVQNGTFPTVSFLRQVENTVIIHSQQIHFINYMEMRINENNVQQTVLVNIHNCNGSLRIIGEYTNNEIGEPNNAMVHRSSICI